MVAISAPKSKEINVGECLWVVTVTQLAITVVSPGKQFPIFGQGQNVTVEIGSFCGVFLLSLDPNPSCLRSEDPQRKRTPSFERAAEKKPPAEIWVMGKGRATLLGVNWWLLCPRPSCPLQFSPGPHVTVFIEGKCVSISRGDEDDVCGYACDFCECCSWLVVSLS
jgi:hypothetical protein